jgi:hypothetical protein
MVAEERLDSIEALRNPGVDPVVAQVIFDGVCPVHVRRLSAGGRAGCIGRSAYPAVMSATPENALTTPTPCAREMRSPRRIRASSTVTTG